MSQDDNIRKLILLVKISLFVQAVTLVVVGFFVFAQISQSDKRDADYQQELTKYHKLIDDWKKTNAKETEPQSSVDK